MKFRVLKRAGSFLIATGLLAAVTASCSEQDMISLTVNSGNRSMSKLPLVIAWDQGLFEKHGLNVELLMPASDFPGGRDVVPEIDWWTQLKRNTGLQEREVDIYFQGATPMMLRAIQNAPDPHNINIGSTDCAVRTHIIGRKGLEIETLEDLAGMRLGASSRISTTGFQLLLFAQRMGWDPDRNIRFVEVENEGFEELVSGDVDAIFVNEVAYSTAVEEGYPVLYDTSQWNEEVAGNSIAVPQGWLEEGDNREAARRFLMATAEAISFFHQDRALALRIMEEWNGMHGDFAERIYERGAWLPRKPYPCYQGYQKTIELHDSPEVRTHGAEEFYDDSVMRDIDATGFFDNLYR